MINSISKSLINLNSEIKEILKVKDQLSKKEKTDLIDRMYDTRNILIFAIREIDDEYIEYDELDNDIDIFIDDDIINEDHLDDD